MDRLPEKPVYQFAFDEFKKAANYLHAQAWFEAGGWTLRLSAEDSATTGPSIQLSKVNWFNEDGRGIHYETWVAGEEQLRHQEMTFVMHVLHQPTFPGTGVKPTAFMSRFRTRARERIQGWGLAPGLGWEPRSQRYGYHIKTGKMSAFSRECSFAEQAVSRLTIDEFTRFTALGPIVDRILEEILPGKTA